MPVDLVLAQVVGGEERQLNVRIAAEQVSSRLDVRIGASAEIAHMKLNPLASTRS